MGPVEVGLLGRFVLSKEKTKENSSESGKPTKQHSSWDRNDLLHDVIWFCKQQSTPKKDMMTINENYARNIW